MNTNPLYSGGSHASGHDIPVTVIDTGEQIRVEGGEFSVCAAAMENEEKLEFRNKTALQILQAIHQRNVCKFEQGKEHVGNHIVCKYAVLDPAKRNLTGSVREIFNILQSEKQCQVSYDYLENLKRKYAMGGYVDICTPCGIKHLKEPYYADGGGIHSEIHGPLGISSKTSVDKDTAQNIAKIIPFLMEDGGPIPFDVNNPDIRFDEGGLIPNKKSINSSEFKKWFKNSAVIDGHGIPKIMYHGTKRDFGIFEKGHKNTYHPSRSLGFFFGDTTIANMFAGGFDDHEDDDDKAYSVIPVYLSIQNPYTLNFEYILSIPDEEGVKINLKNKTYYDTKFGKDRRQPHWSTFLTAVEIKNKLISEGYDGIKIPADKRFRESKSIQFVAFYPNQIKSAIGNHEFDPNNPDIRFEDGGGIGQKETPPLTDAQYSDKLLAEQKVRTLIQLLNYKILIPAPGRGMVTKEDAFINDIAGEIYFGKEFHSKADPERTAKTKYGFTDKQKVKELTEYAILKVGREIAKGYPVDEAYKRIVALYEVQPYITHRTSLSQQLQQFSTPIPFAFLMGVFCGDGQNNKILLEPTAGNGFLTISGAPENFIVNEIDRNRFDNLQKDNYKLALNQDALKPFPIPEKSLDGVIANPPFGAPKDGYVLDGFLIVGLAQKIIINALKYVKDESKSAFIIGGWTEFTEKGTLKTFRDKNFFGYLWHSFNVIDVIQVSGDLYGKQGTVYSIRIILLGGRKTEKGGFYPLRDYSLDMFTPFSPHPVMSFEQLYKRFKINL